MSYYGVCQKTAEGPFFVEIRLKYDCDKSKCNLN